MEDPRLSVVVVSVDRPQLLARCLTSVWQAAGPQVELVVVADAAGLEVVAALPFGERVKTAHQDPPNVADARNTGIAIAAGEIVAFLDDDAVADPTWPQTILARFAEEPELSAITGQVLGRNGVSLQWGNTSVDRQGVDRPGGPQSALPGGPVFQKLHGTNMAFRRAVLCEIGGFDPRFEFYLDDTDIAIRLAEAGAWVTYDPAMIVAHGFAASARRTDERVPLSLHDIGASTAVFLTKHAPDQRQEALTQLRDDQQKRLFRISRRRKLGPREIEDLLTSLNGGIETGLARAAVPLPTLSEPSDAFLALRETPAARSHFLCGWVWRAASLRGQARLLVEAGEVVDLLLLDPTPRKHRRTFVAEGWWEQRGGLFGPADRRENRLQVCTRSGRAQREQMRLRNLRNGAPASPVS